MTIAKLKEISKLESARLAGNEKEIERNLT